jgi:hypothetical protein
MNQDGFPPGQYLGRPIVNNAPPIRDRGVRRSARSLLYLLPFPSDGAKAE